MKNYHPIVYTLTMKIITRGFGCTAPLDNGVRLSDIGGLLLMEVHSLTERLQDTAQQE
jgi:hypothetical protein